MITDWITITWVRTPPPPPCARGGLSYHSFAVWRISRNRWIITFWDPFELVKEIKKKKNSPSILIVNVLYHNDNLIYLSSFSSPSLSWSFIAKTDRFSITILQSLHQELFTLNPAAFFVPSFLKAINDNTEQSFRSIISEPSPGIFIFQMLQPRMCELFLSEVHYHFNYHYLWYKQYLIFEIRIYISICLWVYFYFSYVTTYFWCLDWKF